MPMLSSLCSVQIVEDLKREGKAMPLQADDLKDMIAYHCRGEEDRGRLYEDDLSKIVRLSGIQG